MSDLIDRQAAIDFIDAGHLVNPNEPRWSDNEVVNFLKSRPSAQSKQSADMMEVVRCKDCKWWRDSDHTCRKWGGASPRLACDYCSNGERKEGGADANQTD